MSNYTIDDIYISKYNSAYTSIVSGYTRKTPAVSEKNNNRKTQLWIATSAGELVFLKKSESDKTEQVKDVTIETANIEEALLELESKWGLILFDTDVVEYLYTVRSHGDIVANSTDVYLLTLDIKDPYRDILENEYHAEFVTIKTLKQKLANNDRQFYYIKDSLNLFLNIVDKKLEFDL
ncbi:MAG: hypothetical protein WCJ19_04280 [bacterium]